MREIMTFNKTNRSDASDRRIAAVDPQVGAGHEARGVARKIRRGAADLSVCPRRPIGCFGTAWARASAMLPYPNETRSVSTAPGDGMLTRMLLRASLAAFALASWMSAPW